MTQIQHIYDTLDEVSVHSSLLVIRTANKRSLNWIFSLFRTIIDQSEYRLAIHFHYEVEDAKIYVKANLSLMAHCSVTILEVTPTFLMNP